MTAPVTAPPAGSSNARAASGFAPPSLSSGGPAPLAPPAPTALAMADSTAIGRWLTLLDAILVAALAAIAIVPFRTLFVSSRVIVLAVGIVVLSLVVNLVVRRLPGSVAAVIGVLLAVAYVVVVVFRVGIDDGQTLSVVWHGVSGSWADLLTATVPASTTPELASLPVIVAWLAAEIGVMLSLRTRSATAPIIPCLVAFGIALTFTGQQGVASPIVVGSLVALALIVVLVRANLFAAAGSTSGGASRGFGMDVSKRSLPIGQMRLGVLVVALVALGAVVVGPRLPITSEADRVDLHDRYDPPLNISDSLSPLSTLRAGLNDPSDEPLFTVRFDGVPEGTTIDRVRSVVLDTYDGTVWGTDATFARAGTEIPAGEPVVAPTVAITQQYTLAAYASSFLPALDRPVTVDGTQLGFDRSTGMLVRGDVSGVAGTGATTSIGGSADGFTYKVTSDVATITDDQARQSSPGNDPAFSRLALPPPGGWPKEITDFAGQFPTTSNPFDLLIEIQDELLSPSFGYNPKARPGHSLGVLVDFLTAPVGGNGIATARVGYAEQFAAAFAVLARAEGLPSRVVVGYRVDPVAAANGDEITVLAQDIHAWAEVSLNGVGWFAFDPTNPTERDPVEPPAPETTVAPIDTVAPSTVPPTSLPNDLPPAPTDKRSGGGGPSLALLAIPLAILLVPLSILGLKLILRRRRRSRGDATSRIVGAWLEARDRLVASGQRVGRGATVTEAAMSVPIEVAPALTALAPLVDRALYAPTEPDDDLVAAAWQAESVVTKTVNDESGFGDRLKALLNPRPLMDAFRRSREP